MIKTFKHKGLERFFTAGQEKGVRTDHVKKLRLILGRLDASKTPKDMNLPGLRLHPLKGELRGFYAVDVSGNWQVIFCFEGQDVFDIDYKDYH